MYVFVLGCGWFVGFVFVWIFVWFVWWFVDGYLCGFGGLRYCICYFEWVWLDLDDYGDSLIVVLVCWRTGCFVWWVWCVGGCGGYCFVVLIGLSLLRGCCCLDVCVGLVGFVVCFCLLMFWFGLSVGVCWFGCLVSVFFGFGFVLWFWFGLVYLWLLFCFGLVFLWLLFCFGLGLFIGCGLFVVCGVSFVCFGFCLFLFVLVLRLFGFEFVGVGLGVGGWVLVVWVICIILLYADGFVDITLCWFGCGCYLGDALWVALGFGVV